MARKQLISHMVLALALSGAVASVPAAAQEKAEQGKAKKAKKGKAGAPNYSDGFRKAAAPIEAAMTAATAGISGALDDATRQAAKAKFDAGVGGDGRAALASAQAAATTPDDKMALSTFMRNYGVFAQDQTLIAKSSKLALESGALPADQIGKANFEIGVSSYQTEDYANAATYFKAAKDAGYRDPDNQIDLLLASSYKLSNNSAGGLVAAQQEIDAAKAKGQKPSEVALRTALQAALDSKQVGPANDLSAQLIEYYPRPETLSIAVQIARSQKAFGAQEDLDLMRLMSRMGALSTRSDYLSYIQDADPRRLPGETLKIIDQGVSSGKLSAADAAESRGMATARVAADRAALPSYEKDARSPSAKFASINGAADAFLSYEQPAKAEELYKLALPKAAAEKDRVLTRLGIAQVDQGKYADAQSTFAQVSGVRTPVAKLWLAYIKGKTAAASAPAATAPQS